MTILTKLTTKAPQKAGKKPLTEKPRPNWSESHEVRLSIRALITNVKRPKDKISRGRVNNRRTGLM